MRNRLVQYQKETGNLYNLEATPAEGITYRFSPERPQTIPRTLSSPTSKNLAQGAQPFYTNSSHLPVQYTDDIIEALNIQDNLQTKYTGGTVMHLFLGERIADAARYSRAGEKNLRELPPAVFHHNADVQHLRLARLHRGRAFALPDLRPRVRGVLAHCRILAAGQPVERRQTSGIQGARNVRPAQCSCARRRAQLVPTAGL